MDFPKDNLILVLYILSAQWLHLLEGLGHYVISPWEIEKVLAMNNNIMNLGYTYSKRRLKNPPDIFYKLIHTGWIIVWIPSRLAWTLELLGRDQSLLCTTPPHGVHRNKQLVGPDRF